MQNKKKYNLKQALYTLNYDINAEDEKSYLTIKNIYLTVLSETGLTAEEYNNLMKEDATQTLGNLFYRIINFMNKKKLDTSHIY